MSNIPSNTAIQNAIVDGSIGHHQLKRGSPAYNTTMEWENIRAKRIIKALRRAGFEIVIKNQCNDEAR